MMDRGLYIEFKPAPSDQPGSSGRKDLLHSYLVYRDGRGGAWVVRGGPSGLDGENVLQGAIDQLKFGPAGKIQVEADIPLNESRDAYGPNETPKDRHATKLDLGQRDPKAVFDETVRKATEIGKANIDYDMRESGDPDQNSNSLIRALLENSKVPIETAVPRIIDRAQIRGFENDLESALSDAERERNRANPIEGEIGGTPGADEAPKPAGPRSDAGGDGGDTDEVRKFLDDATRPGDGAEDVLLKRPQDMTMQEVMALKRHRMDLPPGPERDRALNLDERFFDETFSTEPMKFDATGRMIEPEPVRPIPAEPRPVAGPDGEPLERGLKAIARSVADDARDAGLGRAIRALQGGLNVIAENHAGDGSVAAFPRLKEDGEFGPRTRAHLRRAIATLGRPKIEEALALGRFNAFARDARKATGESTGELARISERAFAPLFRNPMRPVPETDPRPEASTLQEAINDLGNELGRSEGPGRFEPLRLDGLIGPRTESAFRTIARATGPETLTRRFGEFLGFI